MRYRRSSLDGYAAIRKVKASNANGEVDKSKSLTVEKGVLGSGGEDQLRTRGGMVKFDYYQANGDQARNLFEFAANNSDVEWGLNVFSDGNLARRPHEVHYKSKSSINN